MMRRVLVISLLGLIVGVLVGCGPQAAPELPTLIPTAPVEMTPTAAETATEPPTAVPAQRPTLPPTWTPSPAPSETPSPTVAAAVELPPDKPTLVVCSSFRIDQDSYNPIFQFGNDITVAWFPVQTAQSYRVNLIDEQGVELYAGYVSDTRFTFTADLFERGKRYGWNVYPMDSAGQQMCFSVGGELIPR